MRLAANKKVSTKSSSSVTPKKGNARNKKKNARTMRIYAKHIRLLATFLGLACFGLLWFLGYPQNRVPNHIDLLFGH